MDLRWLTQDPFQRKMARISVDHKMLCEQQ